MLQEAAAYKKKWQKAQRARLKDGCDEDSFVYLHLNADDSLPHHVGMGYTPGRPWDMKRNRKHRNKVAKHGVRVEIIADELTFEAALWWEVRWIKALKAADYELTNLTDGGEGTKGYFPPEEVKSKMRGPRPIISEQKKGHWTGDNNPNKRPENKEKLSVRMKENNPLFKPEVLALRSGEYHHSKKEGWVNPNLGRPNLSVKKRMLIDNPMKSPEVARKANDKRKENGNGWEGNKNPSSKMTKEQLIERANKSAKTRRLNKLLKDGV